MYSVTILLLLVSILAQGLAFGVAVALVRRASAHRVTWMALAAGVGLIVLIRISPLDFALTTGIFDFYNAVVGVLVSLFLLLALWGLRRVMATLERQKREIEQLTVCDSLTGLFNRRYTLEQGAQEMLRAARSGQPLAVLLIDLDHFKRVNERYGPIAGDAVLIAVADALRAGLRQVDVLGRTGSVEFLLILPNTSPEGARLIAERLCSRIAQLSVVLQDGQHLGVAVNLGGAMGNVAPGEASEVFQHLLMQADSALIVSKERGRNRVEFWSSEMSVQAS